MQKNSTKSIWNVKNLVFMALLVAMQLVLTRVLVLDLGPYRITVGTVCTVLAGLWMGPVAGGAVSYTHLDVYKRQVYATVFILDFVAHWNDFMWPFLVMTGEDKRTIQLAVQSFFRCV